jgi:hypothetical protein
LSNVDGSTGKDVSLKNSPHPISDVDDGAENHANNVLPSLSSLRFHLHRLSWKVLVEGLGEKESLIWMELRTISHGGVWTVPRTAGFQKRIQSNFSS